MSEVSTPTAPGSEVGLSCRKCGHRRFHVVYTRAAKGGCVVRRRACLNCGTRITTRERDVRG